MFQCDCDGDGIIEELIITVEDPSVLAGTTVLHCGDEVGFAQLPAAQAAEIRRQDVLRFLARPAGTYDLVLCDPPYDDAPRVAAPLSEALPALARENARIVTESDKRNPLLLPLPLLVERTYGDTRVAIHSST